MHAFLRSSGEESESVGQVTEADSDHRPCGDDGDEWVASLNAASLLLDSCIPIVCKSEPCKACVWIVMRIEAHKQ